MYISYLPDEMDVGFEESLKIGAELGLKCAEMRSVDGVNVVDLSDSDVERAKSLLDQYGMSVSALATPFLKCSMPGLSYEASGPMHQAREMSYQEHLDLIKRGAEIAKVFGTDRMRLFSFWHREDVDFWETLNKSVKECLDLAEGTGITLALENEGACFVRTSADLAEAAKRLDDPRLKFIYDPGNSAHAGLAPRPEDFEVFKDRIALVHIKDGAYNAEQGTSKATLIGEGDVDYPTTLKSVASVYDGPLTLEPHYKPDGDSVAGMKGSVKALRRLCEESGVKLS